MPTTYYRKPHYYETDQMQVVHHSNYIRWYEEARLHFLNSIGFPYKRLEEMGILIPVISVSSNYHEFAKYDDDLRIELSIIEFNGVRMILEYKVYNNLTNKVINTGSSSHCFVDRNYKVIRLQNHIKELYDKILSYKK